MERETFLAAVIFGALTLGSILAVAMWFGDPLSVKWALAAVICGYVVQVSAAFGTRRWYLASVTAWIAAVWSATIALYPIVFAG